MSKFFNELIDELVAESESSELTSKTKDTYGQKTDKYPQLDTSSSKVPAELYNKDNSRAKIFGTLSLSGYDSKNYNKIDESIINALNNGQIKFSELKDAIEVYPRTVKFTTQGTNQYTQLESIPSFVPVELLFNNEGLRSKVLRDIVISGIDTKNYENLDEHILTGIVNGAFTGKDLGRVMKTHKTAVVQITGKYPKFILNPNLSAL